MPGLAIFEQELKQIARLLEKQHVPYMVIGGLAVAIWGNPRATIDIDITVWISDDQIENLLKAITQKYKCMVDSPFDFISETSVLPIRSAKDLRIDIIFGALPFEKTAIERAVIIEVGETPIKFCTAEDLILLKIFSERSKDLDDIRGIVQFQREKLDYTFLDTRIEELSNLLDRPEIWRQWVQWKNE